MQKYYYECQNRECNHIHESPYKGNPERCEKCNERNVTFLAMWTVKKKSAAV